MYSDVIYAFNRIILMGFEEFSLFRNNMSFSSGNDILFRRHHSKIIGPTYKTLKFNFVNWEEIYA